MSYSANYPPPFDSNLFYYLPVRWLQQTRLTTELDTHEAILSCVQEECLVSRHTRPTPYGGALVLSTADGHDEDDWMKSLDGLAPLFSRPTYHAYRNRLIAEGRLCDPLNELFALAASFDLIVAQSNAYACLPPPPASEQVTPGEPRLAAIDLGSGLAVALTNFRQARWRNRRRQLMRWIAGQVAALPTAGLVTRLEQRLARCQQELAMLEQRLDASQLSGPQPRRKTQQDDDEKERLAWQMQASAARLLSAAVQRGQSLTTSLCLDEIAQAYIPYLLADWPTLGELIYRPRTYLTGRWPSTWLGKTNDGREWGARAILLALLYETSRTHAQRSFATPVTITTTLPKIERVSRTLLPAVFAPLSRKASRNEISEGLRHLTLLGVIQETDAGHYHFSSDAFDQPPTWPLVEIARACDLNLMNERHWVELLQAIMLYCRQPANRLKQVWEQHVRNRRLQAPYLATFDDVRDFTRFIHTTGPDGFEHLAHRFESHHFQHLLVRGDEFRLPLDRFTVTSGLLSMPPRPGVAPLPKPQGIQATQLLIEFEYQRAGDQETYNRQLDALGNVAKHLALVLFQANPDNTPTVIVLPSLVSESEQLTYGVKLDLSSLHGQLDYRQPFHLVALGATLDDPLLPHLELRACFRLYFARPRRR